MKEKLKISMWEQFQNLMINRRKRQNRYHRTQIHDRSISSLDTGNAIKKSDGIKLVYGPKHPLLVK